MIRSALLQPSSAIRACSRSWHHVHTVQRYPFCGRLQNYTASSPRDGSDVEKRERFRLPMRQFTITSSSPGSTVSSLSRRRLLSIDSIQRQYDFLRAVSSLSTEQNVPRTLPLVTGIIILATPGFTTWLENEAFMTKLMIS